VAGYYVLGNPRFREPGMNSRKNKKDEIHHMDETESSRHYRLLADNVTDVIWTVDMNLSPTYVSPSITDLLG